MTFGEAIEAIKEGKRVRKTTWKDGDYIHISQVIRTNKNTLYEGNQNDYLDENWEIFPEEESDIPEDEEEKEEENDEDNELSES